MMRYVPSAIAATLLTLAICLLLPPPRLHAPAMQRDESGRVTITLDQPHYQVLYSLNGSVPNATAGRYVAPIDLPGGGTVTTRATTRNRRHLGPVVSQTFPPLPGHPAHPSSRVATTQDRSWPGYDWAERHHRLTELMKEQQPRLVFLGDSIFHFMGGAKMDRQPRTGAKVWNEYYAPRHAVNLGCGWDRIENVLWRVQHGALEGARPEVAVLLIGTNNVPDTPAGEMVDGILNVVQEMRQRVPSMRILVLGILPQSERPESSKRLTIAQVNAKLSQQLPIPAVRYLDLGSRFLLGDGRINPELMPGFLHPNEQGYRVMAEALEPVLKEMLTGPVKGAEG